MTRDDLAAIVKAELARIAPEAEVEGLDPDADLGETLDLDSMDFLNLIVALNERLGVTVPERDYGRIRSLRGALDYLAVLPLVAQATGCAPAPGRP